MSRSEALGPQSNRKMCEDGVATEADDQGGWVAPDHASAALHWQARALRAEAEADQLRPIVQHVAGIVSQDDEGYSQVHRSLIEEARNVVGSPYGWANDA